MIKTTKKTKATTRPSSKNATVQTVQPSVSASPATASTPSPKQVAPRASGISLELVKPEATHVCVAGSFNQWKPESTPLAPAGNGRWIGNLNVQPGRYEYLFVVDGQWLPDPNAAETVSNPFGGRNSVLVVSA